MNQEPMDKSAEVHSWKRYLRKIPGFRSCNRIKSLLAVTGYGLIGLIILGLIFGTPTLALNDLPPTNNNDALISGKTHIDVHVFLLENDQVIEQTKSDSDGDFTFLLKDIEEGTYKYRVLACRGEDQTKCVELEAILVVDRTPPATPTVAGVSDQIKSDNIKLQGESEPNSTIIANFNGIDQTLGQSNDDGTYSLDIKLDEGENSIQIKSKDAAGNYSDYTDTQVVTYIAPTPTPTQTQELITEILTVEGDEATVMRIIDGDTIEVALGDTAETVRLIGIDSPETKDPRTSVQCFGQEATDRITALLTNQTVTLEADKSQDDRDRYERLLRFVFLSNGTNVNRQMIEEGYAFEYTYNVPYKYQSEFKESENYARENKLGLWSDDTCGGVVDVQPTSTPVPTSPPVQTQPTTTPVPAQPTATPKPSAANVIIEYIFYDGVVPQVESDEYIRLKNTGGKSANISGWRINAGSDGQDYILPSGVSLAPGATCKVYTNEVHSDSCAGSFGSNKAIWANKGDNGYLYNSGGSLVDSYSY